MKINKLKIKQIKVGDKLVMLNKFDEEVVGIYGKVEKNPNGEIWFRTSTGSFWPIVECAFYIGAN